MMRVELYMLATSQQLYGVIGMLLNPIITMVGRIVFICIMKGIYSSDGMIITVMNIGDSFVKKGVSKIEIKDFMFIGQFKSLTCIKNSRQVVRI